MELSFGFTKKPRHPTANIRVRRTAEDKNR